MAARLHRNGSYVTAVLSSDCHKNVMVMSQSELFCVLLNQKEDTMTELFNPGASRLEFMKMVSRHAHIPMTEMEDLVHSPTFDPYEDSQWEDGGDWVDND